MKEAPRDEAVDEEEEDDDEKKEAAEGEDAAPAGSASTFYERRLDVVKSRRLETESNPTLALTAGFGALVLLFGIAAAKLVPMPFAVATIGLGLIMLRAGFGGRKKRTRTIVESTRVRVSRTGIEPDGAPRIPAESIAQAYFDPWIAGRDCVRCLDANGRIVFEAEVDGEEDGSALLRALGREPTRRRADFKVVSMMNTTVVRRFLSLFAMIGLAAFGASVAGAMHVSGYAGALLGLLPFLLLVIPTRLEVGLDGVLLRWLWTRRFLPYEKIKEVSVGSQEDLFIVLTDGSKIPIGLPPSQHHEKHVRRDAIRARIEESRRAHGGGARARELAARMARGSRALTEWRSDLARLTEGGGDYREAATRDEDLWRVVEDGGAPEDARAAAALVLRLHGRGDGDAALRLRIAAEAVVSPKLRVALETAADPEAEDTAIDEALASFEGEREQAAQDEHAAAAQENEAPTKRV